MNIKCYEFTVLKSSQAHLIAFCDNWLSGKRKYKRNQSIFSARPLKWWHMESYYFSGERGECSAAVRKLLKQMSQWVVLKVEASVSKGSSQLNFLMYFNSHAVAQVRIALLRAWAKIEETVPMQRIIKIINRWNRKTQFFSVRRELADHSMTIRCEYNPTVTKTHLFLACIRWFFQQRWGITLLEYSLFTWARRLGEDILYVYK